MKYDLPFHFNLEYRDFIKANESRIHSIYFASSESLPSDARIPNQTVDVGTMATLLRGLNVRKYMTLNGRMTPVMSYTPEQVYAATSELILLNEAGALDGLIVLDFYYLSMLASAGLYRSLDIIPSINLGIDSVEKACSAIQHIVKLGFDVPSKIILDRGLNRNMKRLGQVVRALRKDFGCKIELLVNEGCIQHCPYKVNHDIMISLAGSKSQVAQVMLQQAESKGFDVSELNERWGCINHFKTSPADVLKIPFIRPEDLGMYEQMMDVAKISGKVKSNEFVFRAFEAYTSGHWSGNLLDILDATGSTAKDLHVFNDELPADFANKLTGCMSRCHACTYCEDTAKHTIQHTSR